MLFYSLKSKKAMQAMADAMKDGKKAFCIWTGDARHVFDKNGRIVAEDARPMHFDAIEVFPAMTEKERANAHRIAAGRETIRRRENIGHGILRNGPDGLTDKERAVLLSIVRVAYHDSGKIEGCYSIDSCASCEFCCRMIKAAEKDPLIICGACYADRDKYKEISWRTHTLNAFIMSSVLFSTEELARFNIGDLCRYNEDGDTVNETMARNYLRNAFVHPATSFGYWYKNSGAVEKGLHAEGIFTRDALPLNVRFIHSSILIGIPAAALWFDDAIFTVYPDKATTDAAIAAGAHECNGRRCRECGYTCYLMTRGAEPLYIAEYLRTGAANRASICALHAARTAQNSIV